MSASLRGRLAGIGEPAKLPLGLWSSFGRRTPLSLRTAIDGMVDPGMGAWVEIGQALSIENTDDSEEAQGIASDGSRWFVSSNGSKRVTIHRDSDGQVVDTIAPTLDIIKLMWTAAGSPGTGPFNPVLEGFNIGPYDAVLDVNTFGQFNPHFGALCFFDGRLFVPTQWPFGIWRINLQTHAQAWSHVVLPDNENNQFPWCAIHPVTGVLYTANYDTPQALRAYDRSNLARRPADDIRLGPAPLPLDHVQGGTFTPRGRVLLVRSDDNAVFCYSSLNGHCFGARTLGDFGSAGSEVEAVTVRNWQINGVPTPLHIAELDNDVSQDDFYLHSFNVPEPGRL